MKVLGLVGVAGFLVAAFTPLSNILAYRLAVMPQIQPAGAVIVLGAGAEAGQLSEESLRRLLYGLVLFRKGYAPLLVVSGPPPRRGPSEASVRDRMAQDMGIPPGAIIEVSNAFTTREEASRIYALLSPRGIKKILLVTASEHMLRARALFARAGFEVCPAPSDEEFEAADGPEGRLKLTRKIFQEIVGRLYYRIAGYI